MTNDQIKAREQGKLAVVADARLALETVLRLEEIRGRGLTFTERQSEDFQAARVHWNDAARELGLAEIRAGQEWSDAEFEEIRQTISEKEQRIQGNVDKMTKLGESVRQFADVRRRLGGADGREGDGLDRARGADPIRDMIESRERQHDFPFIETEQIRALPFLTGDDEVRAISDFANNASLFMNDFAGRVAMFARTASPWLGLGTVVTSDNGRPLVVPTLTGDVTVYSPGEGTAITASDPTLASVTVTPTGFKALSYISREAMEDEHVNLSTVLAKSHARAIGLAFGSAFTTTVLAGIQNAGTASGIGGTGTATTAFFGYEDLIDLQYGRAAPYRLVGTFVMANSAIRKVRKFRDAQGEYLWPSENLASGQPPALMGGSVWEDPYLAAPASATKSVTYGDWSSALVIKATPIRVELSTDFLFDKDQVAIKSVQRIAGAVQDAFAAAYLVSANS